jgi:hypothetical protein
MLDPLRPLPPPTERGAVTLRDGAALAYARWAPRGASSSGGGGGAAEPPPPPRARAVLVVGALATARHLARLAAFLSEAAGYEVLTYDHRGAGLSAAATAAAAAAAAASAAAPGTLGGPAARARRAAAAGRREQSAQLLARDALALLDAVWGRDAAVHVYG